MRTVLLLFCSNMFMTIAWYWHLKGVKIPIWQIILISWGIALLEYCLVIPANRIGFNSGWTGFQLKITQEVISLLVFVVFAVLYLKEPLHWKYLASMACILGAVYFAFVKN
jgi:uncharacterized protein (DUF486 family)